MKLLYKTKINNYGIDYYIVIDHEEKTYNENSRTADLDIIVTQKQLKELKKLIKIDNYKNIGL